MTPTVVRNGYSHDAHQPPRPSLPSFGYASWRNQLQRYTTRTFSTEKAVGFALAAVTAAWGGWLVWALARAMDNYRVF